MPAALWTLKEAVIAFYFISREFRRCTEVASKVIQAKCGSTRSPKSCSAHVSVVRKTFGKKYGLKDPYDNETNKYDLDIVDEFLSCLMDKETLEKVLGVKDGKITDKEVQDILDEELGDMSTEEALPECEKIDWKLRIKS